jgi:hypothetical protein
MVQRLNFTPLHHYKPTVMKITVLLLYCIDQKQAHDEFINFNDTVQFSIISIVFDVGKIGKFASHKPIFFQENGVKNFSKMSG